jgi:23S rRNA (guanine1835-N2)-methyltransferase
MKITFSDKSRAIQRYPETSDQSLRPWSAADELLRNHLVEEEVDTTGAVIYNDRFGFITCTLHASAPFTVLNYASQQKAITMNLERSGLALDESKFILPLDKLAGPIPMGLIKIPKSTDLFALQLQQLHKALADDGHVICCFMTRHFSPKLIAIAETYFEEVEQSKAWKKARLLLLRGKKKAKATPTKQSVTNTAGDTFKQYFGVFSSNHIDYATEFLIEHMVVPETTATALDLASGNGVLAHVIRQKAPAVKLELLDDSFLAVASSKLNLAKTKTKFHWSDDLEGLKADHFDLIVSNPPFHFDYETNIDIAVSLFKGAHRCLKADGKFQLVANRHLNYKTQLMRLYATVEIVAETDKFVVYSCAK